MTVPVASVLRLLPFTDWVLRTTCPSGSKRSSVSLHLVEIHLHRRLGADAAGTEAALQHFLDRAAEAQLGGAAEFLGGERVAGGADRAAGAGQQGAAAVDDGDVLRPQARHRGGDEIQDRLHALVVQPRGARHGEQHRGLRVLLLAGERLPPGQHQMNAHRAHAGDGPDACAPVRLPARGSG